MKYWTKHQCIAYRPEDPRNADAQTSSSTKRAKHDPLAAAADYPSTRGTDASSDSTACILACNEVGLVASDYDFNGNNLQGHTPHAGRTKKAGMAGLLQ